MYHRIAQPTSDVWEISVSKENFETQLSILKKKYNVISLDELVRAIDTRTVPNKSVAITFDDGYLDNYLVAKPILEKYQLPATFFVCSGHINSQRKFWWDELESLILFTKTLPQIFNININGTAVDVDLQAEEQLTETIALLHKKWKAGSEAFPTRRSELYYKIWEKLKPLTDAQQQWHLEAIRNLAGCNSQTLEAHTISKDQIKEFASSALFSIQAHTVTHPSLPYHAEDFQRKEIVENKQEFEELTRKKVDFIAYPYGNYSTLSKMIARDAGYRAGFTTDPVTIKKSSDQYSLGRFQVNNLSGDQFEDFLKKSFNL